jgi:hypothetical protein
MTSFLRLFFAGLILSTTSLAFAAKNLENIELKWKPTTDLKEIVATNLGSIDATISVPKFKDSRNVTPPNKVGENKEKFDKGIILPVTTSSDIADFVTTNFKDVLHKSGLKLSDGKGDLTLQGEITDYFVNETNNYEGSMIVKLVLLKGDKPIWKGTVSGTNKRFGRSYKYDNYMETLSDLIVDLTTKLASTADFKAQLQ